ncbi:MAG TPA: type II toxin-antitoxin system VapC family toxin [Dyella sp.]|uniref:type II toxin-antitoxin system VapC family toxin n=1 Tax=Dyella sp. TaxID=1869338 RepID=UPI002B85F5DD|nr:type II toxin-antitoxin system VapC family toxin [Dyella sp.]HUB88249.1 type II toxin-antitoxin system VapC family toxin [Dyella sp.]
MIIVDTSIWIDHLRSQHPFLTRLLHDGQVLVHPLVIGELACGSLPNRTAFLGLLNDMPAASVATHAEIMHFIEHAKLYSRGVGYMDVSLLASVRLTAGASIWTGDKRLKQLADELGLAAQISH